MSRSWSWTSQPWTRNRRSWSGENFGRSWFRLCLRPQRLIYIPGTVWIFCTREQVLWAGLHCWWAVMFAWLKKYANLLVISELPMYYYHSTILIRDGRLRGQKIQDSELW